MNCDNWTTELVEAFLSEAATIVRGLPEVRVRGHFNTWPDIVRADVELSGFSTGRSCMAPAGPQAISRMEQTLLWLRWIERDDQRIVWARANGRPWKAIAHDLGV